MDGYLGDGAFNTSNASSGGCIGGITMNLPQDNEPLREESNPPDFEGFETYLDATKLGLSDSQAQQVLAWHVQLQTRLKAELTAKLREMLPDKKSYTNRVQSDLHSSGFNEAIDQVSAALDTLERGA